MLNHSFLQGHLCLDVKALRCKHPQRESCSGHATRAKGCTVVKDGTLITATYRKNAMLFAKCFKRKTCFLPWRYDTKRIGLHRSPLQKQLIWAYVLQKCTQALSRSCQDGRSWECGIDCALSQIYQISLSLPSCPAHQCGQPNHPANFCPMVPRHFILLFLLSVDIVIWNGTAADGETETCRGYSFLIVSLLSTTCNTWRWLPFHPGTHTEFSFFLMYFSLL